jgi:hydroxyethylthiazole kinase-like uncharacterized protein yjeF
VIPVLTPEEMAAVDAAAPEPVHELVERAGAAVARVALEMMGGGYGRRVVILAGPGNNGADGRACARRLARRGVRAVVIDVAMAGPSVPAADLYIDAAFGTGLKRAYVAPERLSAKAPVLAVDIPSGVDGLTGCIVDDGRPWAADRTVTFAALKPGLVLEPGRRLAGTVHLVDIGLAVGQPGVNVVEDADLARWLPRRDPVAHKWSTACRVIGGTSGMTGAATLASAAAMRSGAGFVQLVRPGVAADTAGPVEAVRIETPATRWSSAALTGMERISAVLIGPGLGTDADTRTEMMAVVAGCELPLVIDADALVPALAEVLSERSAPTILTPHDGEFARVGGDAANPDRVHATAETARALGSHVVRKGPTTVVAAPDGSVRIVTIADQRLASAGTGDVLAGVVLGTLAAGAAPFDAAAGGAHLHALAARLGPEEGLTAGGLVDLIPLALSGVRRG